MDPQATATATVAARRTPPDRARAIPTPTAAAHRTSTGRARVIRTPTAAARRTPKAVAQPTLIPTAVARPGNTGRERLIPTFTVVPLQARTARARTTQARMAMALRIIHPPRTMGIIRPRRSTITDQGAPTVVAGPLRPLSQLPL